MSRESRKGYDHEKAMLDYLAGKGFKLYRPRAGAKQDVADLVGVNIEGRPLLIECKNHARMELGAWLKALLLKVHAQNAFGGVLIHKARGKGAAQQYVTMTTETFAGILRAAVGTDD